MNPFAALKARLAAEDGFAVPTVMLMTVAALVIAGVAVSTSVQGQRGTVRDQSSKSAIAVAESGVSQALLHYNRGVAPCTPPAEGEWCGPVGGMSVNGGQVAYWVRTASGEECDVSNEVECIEIVSQGTFGGTSRRVSVMASTLPTQGSAVPGPFASAGVISLDTITMASNAEIHTGTATGGDFPLSGNARQCGPVTVGLGRKMTLTPNAKWYGDPSCSGPARDPAAAPQKEVTLPVVNQGNAATENDNDRFFDQDIVSSKDRKSVCWDGRDADGTSGTCGSRELRLKSNSSITLGGSVYSFCKLSTASNTAVYIQAGADTTIYFDAPENCPGQSSGVTQLDLSSNSRITAVDGDPTSVALLFVGSDSMQTRIEMSSNTQVDGPCDQNFILYAPRSDISLQSNSRICGAVAGRSIKLESNSKIWAANGSDEYSLPGVEVPETAAHYTPYRFVECSVGSIEPPNSGC